jgi:hypothetical protein
MGRDNDKRQNANENQTGTQGQNQAQGQGGREVRDPAQEERDRKKNDQGEQK